MSVPRSEPEQERETDLPVYTLLVPLYREASVVPRLLAALEGLDYPRPKLDAKLLLEADDDETIRALNACALPAWCEIVTVPDGLPKTKPRALNHGLARARGTLVTIFDAEDMPQPDQLRRAAAAFRDAPSEVACFQARLAWYNWTDSWFTRRLMAQMPPNVRVFHTPFGGVSDVGAGGAGRWASRRHRFLRR